MQNIATQKLTELLAKYGRELGEDARRCEALLKDVCGAQKQAIFVLVSAIKDGEGTLYDSAGHYG